MFTLTLAAMRQYERRHALAMKLRIGKGPVRLVSSGHVDLSASCVLGLEG